MCQAKFVHMIVFATDGQQGYTFTGHMAKLHVISRVTMTFIANHVHIVMK